jgi:leader peptidase (prepilin peptidase)/N-methyltransferase
VVEALTGLLFLLIVLALGVNLPSIKLCLLSALLVGLIFCDMEQRILPDELTLGGIVAGMVFATVVPMEWEYAHLLLPARWDDKLLSAGESVLGAVFASGLLWVVGVVYEKIRHKEGLGFGDVKMMAMVGTFLGMVDAFRTLILGSLLGSVLGILYIRLAKKDFATYELPFGSVLGATALILALYRTRVVSFYLPFLP